MNKLPRSLKQFSKDHKEEMSRSDKFSIDPRLIKARADFNVREIEQMSKEERAAYDEYIDQLAQAYRDGRYVPPIVIKVVDGTPTPVDGHTRHKGMMRAIEVYGAELARVTVEEFKGDDAEEVALIATSQNNRKLKPLELAKVYVRLERYGKTDKEIATTVGVTAARVAQVKAYYSMPSELKALVFVDKISVEAAMDLYNKYGTKAIEYANSMINKNKEKGGKKVTVKNTTPKLSRKESRSLNTATSELYSRIKDIEVAEDAETVSVSLTPELLAQLKEIGARAYEVENFDPEADLESNSEQDSEQ
jgi:ParB-like chromosome segregation protein Spo0J